MLGRRHFLIKSTVSLPSNHTPWEANPSAGHKANAAYTSFELSEDGFDIYMKGARDLQAFILLRVSL